MSRPALVVLASALLLLPTGCGSYNSGKIVGRWKTDAGGPQGPAVMVWEFSDDGVFTVEWVDPATGETQPKARGRYSLGLRDNVLFTNLDPPLDGKTRTSEKIAIDGDTMTVGGGKGRAYRFTRLPPQ